MAGVVLETLNIRKLIAFFACMLLIQVAFFLIGGLIAPAPNTSDQILMSKCVDSSNDPNRWHYTRPLSNESCSYLIPDGDLEEVVPQDIDANHIVFIAQFPHPRGGMELKMTRWFQQVIAVLMLDIKHVYERDMVENGQITFDLRLGYRNRGDPRNEWHELARSTEVRPLRCVLDAEGQRQEQDNHTFVSGFYYDCEVLPLFTLASCHHDEYLLNLRIPVNLERKVNTDIGSIQDVWMVEIHQNGGFTKVWFSLKTFTFPVTLLALIFFCYRVKELNRPMTILEKTIFALGIGLSVLNCPLEWFSLVLNVPFWLILSDIRQGLFYAILVCFWLVFTGEHMMDGSRIRTGTCYFGIDRAYWPRLLLVISCCAALFIFDLAERGVQIRNPFYSIWSHPVAAKLGMATIIIGALCAVAYMIYLSVLVVRAFIQILGKRRLLTNLPSEQRHYYGGIIYRFTVLLAYTLVCAGITVAFFIFNQVTEDQWKWGERSVEYTSAFITGVYGMWNIYVVAVLCLYAPSHKFRSAAGQELYDRLITSSSIHPAPDHTGGIEQTGESIQLIPQTSGASDRIKSPKRGKSTSLGSGLTFIRKGALD